MMFVSRFWGQLIGVKDTHLNDWAYFKGFLWLFLKVIMERDWLGCDDVDECLDKLVFCLTRHNNGNRLQVYAQPRREHVTPNPLARAWPGPAYSYSSLVSYLGGFSLPWL
jgi:hypothetical protein